MEYLIASIVLLIVLVFLFLKFFRHLTIFEFEKGLLYSRGIFKKTLNPGSYWYCKLWTTISKHDIRNKYMSLVGQELLTSDNISIKISLSTEYEIADLAKTINKFENYQSLFYLEIQMILRDIIAGFTAEEIMQKREVISSMLKEKTGAKASYFGVDIKSIGIKDIMFPGSLKEIFANVLKAQKQAQADLERARGQTASLRHLANAAQMLDKNPSLLNLRILQTISESAGNTFVLKMADDTQAHEDIIQQKKPG